MGNENDGVNTRAQNAQKNNINVVKYLIGSVSYREFLTIRMPPNWKVQDEVISSLSQLISHTDKGSGHRKKTFS